MRFKLERKFKLILKKNSSLVRTMFNFYQNINRRSGSFGVGNAGEEEQEQQRELDVIGHDRFFQRSSRSSVRKRKKISRRARSSGDLLGQSNKSTTTSTTAFMTKSRSQSIDQSSTESSKNNSINNPIKLFSRRSSSVPRHEYSALRVDCSSDVNKFERQVRDGAFTTCSHYLADNDRYVLRSHLGNVGSRLDKHWFVVQDTSLGAERLLTLVPRPSECPINPTEKTRDMLVSLFRSLQHPYIHPILDLEFWDSGVALISPLNPSGSLKDIIYRKAFWHDEYDKKYRGRGEGLPLRQIQCLGRQILEGLLFLKNRNFPPFYHLHTGNVIIQNGAARLAGLENALFGIQPKIAAIPETLSFGYLLFEITTGYELSSPPSLAHLELELETTPKIADVLNKIFFYNSIQSFEEIICLDLFRGVELRELRGANGVQTRTPSDVLELLELVNNPPASISPPSVKRDSIIAKVECRRLEDIIEEEYEVEDEIISVEVHR